MHITEVILKIIIRINVIKHILLLLLFKLIHFFKGILHVNEHNPEEAFLRFQDDPDTKQIIYNQLLSKSIGGKLKEIFIPGKHRYYQFLINIFQQVELCVTGPFMVILWLFNCYPKRNGIHHHMYYVEKMKMKILKL